MNKLNLGLGEHTIGVGELQIGIGELRVGPQHIPFENITLKRGLTTHLDIGDN